jgi:translation initiation factor IF-3
LNKAEERGLDLVEIAPSASPPVCRIMNYGKYRYEQSKKQQQMRKSQKQIQVKEVKFRPKIEEHDYQFKKKHIIRFLAEGNLVKATLRFRGREITHVDYGKRILNRLIDELEDVAVVEKEPKLEGRNLIAILSAKKSKTGAKKEQ